MVSYRTLDGLDGSNRYLLSARDGRMLERALLDGASQRLNRRRSYLPVHSFPAFLTVAVVDALLVYWLLG